MPRHGPTDRNDEIRGDDTEAGSPDVHLLCSGRKDRRAKRAVLQVSITTPYLTRQPGQLSQCSDYANGGNPDRGRDSYFLHSVHTSYGDYLDSYVKGTAHSFQEDKVAGTCRSPLTPSSAEVKNDWSYPPLLHTS